MATIKQTALIRGATPHDVYETPFGPLQGASIHALATHSLATGRWVDRRS